jgi:DNA-binding MarR family transcriptional regulator
MSKPFERQILALLPQIVHRLTAAGDAIHAARGLTTGMRSTLLGLSAHGPRTVSHMADDRPVSRQYMQRVCDDLATLGLVEARDNPRHKRSPLIALTRAGAAMVREIGKSEAPYAGALVKDLSEAELAACAHVLQTLCARLSPEALRGLERGLGPAALKQTEGV